ncbi:hypothetical protein EV201_0223 [Ancylomarina subtilis]|uniref:Lipoprotein n=1 Tax=Ancylomarina subtilis TaxID=1639035 RepID=A0A4Q7VHL9_9BACT|nr:hypothetical protein [Ancylomarina subtilis]RZT95600.1 hypothetical protein EV201_0223 [Ancylomarina subtilis]
MKTKLIRLSCIILISMFAMMGCKNHSKRQENIETYQSEVMLKLFSIKTSNDLIIKIPETNTSCKINKIIDKDSLHIFEGHYAEGEERGVVYIDYKNIVALNQSTENETYLIIPFSVSNQGSGIFRYIGLFDLNHKDMTIKHVDSKFLGDRIKLESIQYDGNKVVQIKMKIHSKEQSMSQTPTETKEIDFNVDRDKLKYDFD